MKATWARVVGWSAQMAKSSWPWVPKAAQASFS
jgi:hypothetical protein